MKNSQFTLEVAGGIGVRTPELSWPATLLGRHQIFYLCRPTGDRVIHGHGVINFIAMSSDLTIRRVSNLMQYLLFAHSGDTYRRQHRFFTLSVRI